jgi:hypothetical protein
MLPPRLSAWMDRWNPNAWNCEIRSTTYRASRASNQKSNAYPMRYDFLPERTISVDNGVPPSPDTWIKQFPNRSDWIFNRDELSDHRSVFSFRCSSRSFPEKCSNGFKKLRSLNRFTDSLQSDSPIKHSRVNIPNDKEACKPTDIQTFSPNYGRRSYLE